MAPPTQAQRDAIEKAFYDEHLAYASPKTIHRELRATIGAGAPTLSQIIEVLKQQVITQTFKDNKTHRSEYDSIVAKGLRHVVQMDLLDMSFWRKSNKLPGSRGEFIAVACFMDLYSRKLWAYPLESKDNKRIKRSIEKAWADIGGFRNLTSDAEAGLLSNTVLDYLSSLPSPPKLWINNKGTRGPWATYTIERSFRDLRVALNRFVRLHATHTWVYPLGENVTTNARLQQLRANDFDGTPIMDIVEEKNNRFHSKLGGLAQSDMERRPGRRHTEI